MCICILQLVYFFEADRRIDFRDLVSELFSMYKTRIWMQQVDTSVLPDHELRIEIARKAGFLASSYDPVELYNYADPSVLSAPPPALSPHAPSSLTGLMSPLSRPALSISLGSPSYRGGMGSRLSSPGYFAENRGGFGSYAGEEFRTFPPSMEGQETGFRSGLFSPVSSAPSAVNTTPLEYGPYFGSCSATKSSASTNLASIDSCLSRLQSSFEQSGATFGEQLDVYGSPPPSLTRGFKDEPLYESTGRALSPVDAMRERFSAFSPPRLVSLGQESVLWQSPPEGSSEYAPSLSPDRYQLPLPPSLSADQEQERLDQVHDVLQHISFTSTEAGGGTREEEDPEKRRERVEVSKEEALNYLNSSLGGSVEPEAPNADTSAEAQPNLPLWGSSLF